MRFEKHTEERILLYGYFCFKLLFSYICLYILYDLFILLEKSKILN